LVISEYHSAAEALWHGIAPNHPLADLPSAEPARVAVERVYEAADRMLGRLLDRFPDVTFAVFNLHGMGPNDSDVPSMALLPELLYRHRFGKPFRRECIWSTNSAGIPIITNGEAWSSEINRTIPIPLLQKAKSRIGRMVHGRLASAGNALSLHWMPAERYRPFWPRMDAFALPSFYDGRIRINLRGRERRGRVSRTAYEAVCKEIVGLLRDCRDPITGLPVTRDIARVAGVESHGASGADLIVLWDGAPLGFLHPSLGQIGPLPYRRTGGHTGKTGVAYFRGQSIRPGQYGRRSAFDVVPTVLELLGAQPAPYTSGTAVCGLFVGE
jgi:hypothetical protein